MVEDIKLQCEIKRGEMGHKNLIQQMVQEKILREIIQSAEKAVAQNLENESTSTLRMTGQSVFD